ncbi:AAA family ATPase [Streptomyces liangshanensis]|uniref:AAA family ATPase n=1 Tax=Streptomyces liangshanensis TaxID=2717324 RepID=UPI0036DE0A7C
MTNFSFTPATREQARARIGLQGPAGCGKTKSALRIAEGLAQGGQIGLIDTERRSALTYAVVPGQPQLGGHEFGHMPMDSYDPRNLIEAVRIAEQARLAVLIIDSWSHFWNGRGGLLEIVENAGTGTMGTFGGWKKGNPIEQDMLDALLNFSGHLIVTMRTKTDYLVDGKKITKVGTKVVQRESSDYELGLIIDMVEGTGTVVKTRYEPLEGLSIHHPGEELGRQVLEQLGQGVDPVSAIIDELTADGLTYQGALELHSKAKSKGLLTTGHLHPTTGETTTIGELIAEYGKALKPGPAPSPSDPVTATAAQSTPGQAGPAPYSMSDAEAAAGAVDFAAPGVSASPEPTPAAGDQATAPQMRKIFASFAEFGLGTDRDRRLKALGLLIGRQINSQNELTFGEASLVCEAVAEYEGKPDAPALFKGYLNELLEKAKARELAPAA